jgi:hypothetical protein
MSVSFLLKWTQISIQLHILNFLLQHLVPDTYLLGKLTFDEKVLKSVGYVALAHKAADKIRTTIFSDLSVGRK